MTFTIQTGIKAIFAEYLNFQGLKNIWTIDWLAVWPGVVYSLVNSRQMKLIKCLEVVVVVELVFGRFLTEAINMKSEEMLILGTLAIIKLK